MKNNGTSGTNNDYTYDNNGNMISDLNKGITSIEYNHLNLPVKIKWNNSENRNIEYLYNAAGQKVRKKVTDVANGTTKTIDYLDGFQYAGGILQFFPTAEGYVKATQINESPTNPDYAFNYVFNYTDHLGNVRLSFSKDPVTHQLKIMEENHYYPFGLKHSVYAGGIKDYKEDPAGPGTTVITNVTETAYMFKFQNQELQDELGLNWYSFKWRNYMPDVGRFFNVDPLSEKYSHQSHYNFSENVVVNSRELEGLERKIAIVLGERGTNDFDSNLNGLSKQGYETSKVTTGQELISNIQQMEGGEKLESVVLLSHGYDAGMIGDGNNVGVYTNVGFMQNAELNFLEAVNMFESGAETASNVGAALASVGFTEGGSIILGGCNLGLTPNVASDRLQNGDSLLNASTHSGGLAGEMAKSAGVPVIASSPRLVNTANGSYEVSGTTQPYPTNSNSTTQRQSSGDWFKFNPNGTQEKLPSRKLNLAQ